MLWSGLMREVQYLALHNPEPKAVLLHVGSNDLGLVKCSVMRHFFRADILQLHTMYPNATICVSAMIPRRDWSRSPIPVPKLEKKRRLLNRFLRRLVVGIGGRFVAHEDITADTPGLYFRDGVHLSDVGSDLFLWSCRNTLEDLA